MASVTCLVVFLILLTTSIPRVTIFVLHESAEVALRTLAEAVSFSKKIQDRVSGPGPSSISGTGAWGWVLSVVVTIHMIRIRISRVVG